MTDFARARTRALASASARDLASALIRAHASYRDRASARALVHDRCVALTRALVRALILNPALDVDFEAARHFTKTGVQEPAIAPCTWGQAMAAQRIVGWMLNAAVRALPADQRANYRLEQAANLAWCETWQEWLGMLLHELGSLPETAWVYRRERRREQGHVSRLFLFGGIGATLATWSPLVQALAVLTVAGGLLAVILARSDKPTERLIAVIKALRGR